MNHWLIKNGNELVDSNHYASQQVEACVDSLKINWHNLDEKYVKHECTTNTLTYGQWLFGPSWYYSCIMIPFVTNYRSTNKHQKLTQVRELQVFEQEVEDIQEWISDMEKQLASEDLGKDLISVNNLLKEHNVRLSQACMH